MATLYSIPVSSSDLNTDYQLSPCNKKNIKNIFFKVFNLKLWVAIFLEYGNVDMDAYKQNCYFILGS